MARLNKMWAKAMGKKSMGGGGGGYSYKWRNLILFLFVHILGTAFFLFFHINFRPFILQLYQIRIQSLDTVQHRLLCYNTV